MKSSLIENSYPLPGNDDPTLVGTILGGTAGSGERLTRAISHILHPFYLRVSFYLSYVGETLLKGHKKSLCQKGGLNWQRDGVKKKEIVPTIIRLPVLVGKVNRVNTVFYDGKYGILKGNSLGRRHTVPMFQTAANPSGSCPDRDPVDQMKHAWISWVRLDSIIKRDLKTPAEAMTLGQ